MQESIDPQIVALRTLQRQDRKLTVYERKLRVIPKRLRELDTDLRKLESMLDAEREKLEETRLFQSRQESQLQDEEVMAKTSKARLGQIKTARELNATQRELESTRRMITTRTEEIAKLQKAVSETEQRITKMDAMLSQLRSQAESEKERLATEKDRLERLILKARKRREKLTKGLDIDTLRTYERIRKRFPDGMAFVPAHRERCTACKMMIPNIIYMQLMKGREILACESCSRLLYWSGHFADDVEKLEPKPKPAPGSEEAAADAS
ncbi:MAG: hypothetical protein H6710_12515 [Myxococcales bacterium]|nr:hypothetical protein [Myxococcales bacterium]MCB9700456.1 hypothetical protein [Myxococcales bacterium]